VKEDLVMDAAVSSSRRPGRYWKTIAEEASREEDPQRLLELVKELNEAIDADMKRKGKIQGCIVDTNQAEQCSTADSS
jgi:sulfur transfer protein SufE